MVLPSSLQSAVRVFTCRPCSRDMAPFRWPSLMHDLSLAKEVAGKKPENPEDWAKIALELSKAFTKDGKEVKLKGRGCKERIQLLIKKNEDNDKRTLKKSGSEEDYTELQQLLLDISTYRRDMKVQKEQEEKDKEAKKRKDLEDKHAGIEMREKAMQGLAKRRASNSDDDHSSDDDSDNGQEEGSAKKGKIRKKATRLSVVQMMEEKSKRKTDLKQRELSIREQELKLQRQRFEEEARERKEKLNLEIEERRMFLELLKNKL